MANKHEACSTGIAKRLLKESRPGRFVAEGSWFARSGTHWYIYQLNEPPGVYVYQNKKSRLIEGVARRGLHIAFAFIGAKSMQAQRKTATVMQTNVAIPGLKQSITNR